MLMTIRTLGIMFKKIEFLFISFYCLLGFGTKCLSSFASFGSCTNFCLTFIAVGTGFMDCKEKLLENRQVMAINPSNRRLQQSHTETVNINCSTIIPRDWLEKEIS